MRGHVTWAALHPNTQSAIDAGYALMRRAWGSPPTVYFYHAPEDPVSDAVAQVLRRLEASLPGVVFLGRTIAPLQDDPNIPKPRELALWAARDVAAVADAYGIAPLLPGDEAAAAWDDGVFCESGIAAARDGLLTAESEGGGRGYLAACVAARAALRGSGATGALHHVARRHHAARLTGNRNELSRAGHWGVGVVLFEGQLYWGLDRLCLLETRLAALAQAVNGSSAVVPAVPRAPPAAPAAEPLHVYLSPRSPYSYVAIVLMMREGVLGHDGLTWAGRRVVLRPMLPNAMRGVPITMRKKLYIARDAARVCHAYKIPFGFICDPLGDAAARILAVVCGLLADRAEGAAWTFLHATMTGAWSRNAEYLSLTGIGAAVAAAGVSAIATPRLLATPGWRGMVEANERELAERHGHWGVPAFRCGECFTWGQDRMWTVRRWLGDHGAAPDL